MASNSFIARVCEEKKTKTKKKEKKNKRKKEKKKNRLGPGFSHPGVPLPIRSFIIRCSFRRESVRYAAY